MRFRLTLPATVLPSSVGTPASGGSSEPYNLLQLRAHPLQTTVPKFTALIHTTSVQGLAQTLRSARIASETLVVHPSDPVVARLCLRYGVRETKDVPGVTAGAYAMDAFHNWLLLLHPGEELSADALRALERWRRQRSDNSAGYLLRREGDSNPQLRLVNRAKIHWGGEWPTAPADAEVLPGLIMLGAKFRAA